MLKELTLAVSELDRYEQAFLLCMLDELKKAKKKHPGNALRLVAVGEEFGEVCKAVLDEPWQNVYKECAQLSSTSLRLAVEGDSCVVTPRLNNNLNTPTGS